MTCSIFHMLICHLYISSLVRYLLRSLAHFLIGSFVSSLLSVKNSYTSDSGPLSGGSLQIFFQSGSSSQFSWHCLLLSRNLILMKSSLLKNFISRIIALVLYPKIHHQTQGHPGFLLCYLLGVSNFAFAFRSVVHFELIFVKDVSSGCRIVFSYMSV